MDRRIGRLETLWSRTGTVRISEQETQLTTQLIYAIRYPSAVAPSNAADQLAYLRRTIALNRAPAGMVARALVAAFVQCGCPEDEAREAVRLDGVDGVLEALAEVMAPIAAEQDEARERDAMRSREAAAAKKAVAREAYKAAYPLASDRDFLLAYARVWGYGDDVEAFVAGERP
jgi:hypothetical protein